MLKNGLVWIFRPLNTCLAIWANFGPFWANISQRGWETPTFYWSPRLYLPIGTWNWPNFGWDIFFHFGLGSKSQETPMRMGEYGFSTLVTLVLPTGKRNHCSPVYQAKWPYWETYLYQVQNKDVMWQIQGSRENDHNGVDPDLAMLFRAHRRIRIYGC